MTSRGCPGRSCLAECSRCTGQRRYRRDRFHRAFPVGAQDSWERPPVHTSSCIRIGRPHHPCVDDRLHATCAVAYELWQIPWSLGGRGRVPAEEIVLADAGQTRGQGTLRIAWLGRAIGGTLHSTQAEASNHRYTPCRRLACKPFQLLLGVRCRRRHTSSVQSFVVHGQILVIRHELLDAAFGKRSAGSRSELILERRGAVGDGVVDAVSLSHSSVVQTLRLAGSVRRCRPCTPERGCPRRFA